MFQFYNLKYAYAQSSANIIDGASGQLLAGDKVVLISPNGVGKYTLLAVLAGLLPGATGEITPSDQKVLLVSQDGLIAGSDSSGLGHAEAFSSSLAGTLASTLAGTIYDYLVGAFDEWWLVSSSWEQTIGKQLELDIPSVLSVAGKLYCYGGNYDFYQQQVGFLVAQAEGKLELQKNRNTALSRLWS